MNLEVIKNPSMSIWTREIYDILENRSTIDIQKLGNVGVYVEQHFNDTIQSKKDESIDIFFYAFEETIDRIISSEILLTPFQLLAISQIINNFRNKKYYRDMSKMEYVNKLSVILSRVIENNERKILEYEKSFYEYSRYLLYFIKDKSKQLPSESILTELVMNNILKTYGVFEDDITNLFYYLLVKLEYKDILYLKQTVSCKIELAELYIAEQDYNNQLLNDLLINFALNNDQIFFSLLDKFNCELNKNLPTAILYKRTLEIKELNPDGDQLRRLLGLGSNSTVTVETTIGNINSLSL
jgi:hypothetical protein